MSHAQGNANALHRVSGGDGSYGQRMLGLSQADLAKAAGVDTPQIRRCASGHNFQPIRTIYRWQGQVFDKLEARVALRTRRSLLPQIVDRTKGEHPYEVPSVVAVPIIDGGPDYLRWILDETEARRA